MNILLIDTCTADLVAAVIRDGKVFDGTEKQSGTRHSQRLCLAVEETMKKAGISFADIHCYACAVGPGSFTGIRIGVATVKGYAAAHNAPFIAVNSLQAIAVSQNCGNKGSAAMDAGNGYYYASYGENAESPRLISYDDSRAVNAGKAACASEYLDGEIALVMRAATEKKFDEVLTPLYIRKCQAEEKR